MRYVLTFVACMSYAMIRYNYFGDVATTQIPSYIVNKVMAFSSICALLFAAISTLKKNYDASKGWFTFFKTTAVLHVFLSLALYSPSYYPKMFQADTGKMNLNGELMILFGILGMFQFASRKILEYSSPRALNAFKIGAALSLALHQFFLGYPGWFKPQTWFGHMLPITMICFVMLLVILVLQLIDSKKTN